MDNSLSAFVNASMSLIALLQGEVRNANHGCNFKFEAEYRMASMDSSLVIANVAEQPKRYVSIKRD